MKSVLLGVSVVCVCRSKGERRRRGLLRAGMAFSEGVGGGENERLGSFLAKVTCRNSWGRRGGSAVP